MHAPQAWQNVSWVAWSNGELRVDPSSFCVVFSPAGCGSLAAKPLGCLLGAELAIGRDGVRTCVVNTNDAVHPLLRLTFQSRQDEDAFGKLAKAANGATIRRGATPARRTSVMRKAAACSVAEMKARVSARHPGDCPVVFAGVELYGPEPGCQNDDSCEVLLARGAIVLLDPQTDGHVGAYQLLFYDEEDADPVLRLQIGPRMSFSPQDSYVPGSRLSVSRRLSMTPGMATSVLMDFSISGEPTHAIAFDAEAEAGAFLRDFRVRQKLVSVSFKTSRGLRAMGALRGEIMDLHSRGFVRTLWRWTRTFLCFLALVLFMHAVLLKVKNPQHAILDLTMVAISDTITAASVVWNTASGAVSDVCTVVAGCVPASSVQRCAALPSGVGEQALQNCITQAFYR